jgi:hypothetical protein
MKRLNFENTCRYILILSNILNMSDITFVKFNQNHYVELSLKTQIKNYGGHVLLVASELFLGLLLVNHFVSTVHFI